ncbi:hypothetical protein DCAR_0104442 [Daucus carota subsp. sativus]|uniref:B box-type domain-containing protein n=1 Tax=Daucus carota subsp. sativus TaxID=79200 RepID=A0AAF0WA10_DAUCS|nr:PREDICTED: zinc finger protein CONSTANS-LIKE 9-like [Daucus carota subsp. sativus]WOG85254.1 hypothetical protein DCAR_0104442 [Daucus carota subsp. sativus]
MKKCELCNSIARMFCESDQASLCWQCDAKVHSANFLVAKHSRTLLCQSCQALTPWTGSGPKLGPTLSFCESCVHENTNYNNDTDEDDEDEEDDEDDEEDEEEDDGENQVVPLSSSSLAPPQVTSSSSSEESSARLFNGAESSRKSRFSISWSRTR